MFKSILVFVSIVTIVLAKPELDVDYFLSDEYIDHLNSIQSTWKAGRNFEKNVNPDYIKNLLGSLDPIVPPARDAAQIQSVANIDPKSIPDTFDAREHWPKCKSIGTIRDQGSCGSCWAIAAAEAISDRICIASNGTKNVAISTQDLLTCCDDCGYGCRGGQSLPAWRYWVEEGLVTGGLYGDNKTCRPYTIEPCEHHVEGPRPKCSTKGMKTPPCERKCIAEYPKSYDEDLHFGKRAYYVSSSVEQIQFEIMTYGPVEAALIVFDDFFSYKSGVYVRQSQKALGGHAIKMLGWGVENGTPYWLCANSWNDDWGDKGYFKIRRGHSECAIESYIVAGLA